MAHNPNRIERSSRAVFAGRFDSAKITVTAGHIRWKLVAAVGGVVWLLVLAGLGIFFSNQHPSKKADVALPDPEIVEVAPPAPVAPLPPLPTPPDETGPIELPMPRLVPEPPETLALMPREAVEELMAPREFVAVAVKPRPEATADPVGPPKSIVASGPPERPRIDAATKFPDTEKPENGSIREKFGTKIDFFPMPTQAYEKSKKEKDKLVMILHIAGNFEDKGFT